MAQYLALVEDLETICCFLDFHKMKELLRKTQYLVIELLVFGQAAKSESLKALSCNSQVEGNNSPRPRIQDT